MSKLRTEFERSSIDARAEPPAYGDSHLEFHYAEYRRMYIEYCAQHTALTDQYEQILSILDRRLYPSRMKQLFEYLQSSWELEYDFKKRVRVFLHDRKITIGSRFIGPGTLHRDMKELDETMQRRYGYVAGRRRNCWALSRKILEHCLLYHRSLRSRYEYGFLQLDGGNYAEAVESMRFLIEESERRNDSTYLTAETFHNFGITCNLSLQYSQAVEALTEALKRDPDHKESYIERAVAYFELGKFDEAVKDYAASGYTPAYSEKPWHIEFGQGFSSGVSQGISTSIAEFPQALLSSMHGMGHFLWAGLSDPVKTSSDFMDAAQCFIGQLRQEDFSTLAERIAPEAYDLVVNWDLFDQKTRGEKTGFVFGKYGIDFAAGVGLTKGLQAYLKLRRANALSTVQAAASERYATQVVQAAEIAAERRRLYCASQKIDMGKQGKHILGHNSYETLSHERKLTQSLWTHPDLQGKIEPCLGTGSAANYIDAGYPGYKEVIDFGEQIGVYITEQGERFETTRAIIHYSKGGVHAVPHKPNNFEQLIIRENQK